MVLRLTAKVCLTMSLALGAGCIGGGEPDPTETATGAIEEEASGRGSVCPDLSGTYECPAWQGQPAYALRVTNRPRSGGVLYRFFYSFLPEPIAFLANRRGVVQDGFVSQCTRYQDQRALVFYPEGGDPATQGTYNFINADGDYQADFAGTTQIVCFAD